MAQSSRQSTVAKAASRVQSVDRAMVLLRAVALASGAGSTAPALADTSGLNRATAWRILRTLETHGMVTCDRDTGRWSIGLSVVEIASSVGIESLVAAGHEVLQRLSVQTGETADLAISRGEGLTYVDEVRPVAIVSARWLGRTVPLHATSTGKALLAFLSDRQVDWLLPVTLAAHTPTTITDRETLDAELALTRQRGYSTCRGELETHLHGVSAPVFDNDGRPIAVVSIWGPESRVTQERLPALGALAGEAAREIARLHDNRAGSWS
ncbi:MAG: IclR family transcriptional regulator [Marmoricola sp.]